MTLDAKVGRRRDKKCNYLKKILHSSCHFRAVIFGKVQKLLILIFEANSVNSLNCTLSYCYPSSVIMIVETNQKKNFAGMEWKHRMKLSLNIQFNY